MLASCAGAPPDFLACTNLGDSGYCRTYVSKKLVTIDNGKHLYKSMSGKTLKWNQVAASSVLIPADWFVKLKDNFDQYCHENQCPDGMGDWNSFATDLGNHLKK